MSRARRRPPRHRSGDPFIKGPIPYAWIASASRLPGSGLHVAMACRFLCGRFRGPNRWGLDAIAKRVADLRPIGPTRPPCGRAGRVAGRGTGAGLQAGRFRLGSPGAGGQVGASAVVRADPLELVAPGLSAPREVSPSWGRLLVLAGWERSADFELALEGWADFGLSRFSASRGLDELERAKLVSVGRTPGRSPIVSILDAGAGSGLP